MAPNRTILAFLGFPKIIEDNSIKRKAEKINQKVPMSNIVPKKDTSETFEKRAERKKAKTTPPPPHKHKDLGKIILPAKKREIAWAITQTVSPATKRKPFPVSIEIEVPGRKKNGNNIMIKKSDKNETLSNIFARIGFHYINKL